ncbi:MAG: hypothetical protein ACUVTZ_07910 [Armatimonadota bacterium]
MALVNLISARRAQRRRLQRMADALFRTLYIVAILAGVALFMILRSVRLTEAETARVREEIESYEPLAGQVRVLRASLQRIQPLVKLAEDTELNVNRWRYLLAQIADAFPRTAWLEGFSTHVGPNGAEVFVLNCRAADVYSAARLYTRLEAEPDVESVVMKGGTWTGNQLTFELEVSVKLSAVGAEK